MRKKKKKTRKFLYLIGAIVLILLLTIWAFQLFKEKGIKVEITQAKRSSITEKVIASGTVQPVTEIKLAPEVSGEVIKLNVKDGSPVKSGQVLVKIRPDVWLSQLERSQASLQQQQANAESSQANLARVEATFSRAQQEYNRQKKLWDQRVISEAEWQLARQNYLVAENDLKVARQALKAALFIVNSTRASVKESKANVEKTTVLSPMTGIVSKLLIKKGERVVGAATMTGTEMMRIANLDSMEIRANVNEADIMRIHLYDSVIIDVDAYTSTGRKFKGMVTSIANTANEKQTTDAITEFEVRISILRSSYEDLIDDDNSYLFRPGLTATVEIVTVTKHNVLSVPLSAVTTRIDDKNSAQKENQRRDENDQPVVKDLSKPKKAIEKEKTVVFINQNGKAHMVEVKTGINDYDNIEVMSGLSDSSQIISGPFLAVSKLLKDEDPILISTKEKD